MIGEDLDAPWRADALCAQTDPEAFFPEKGGSTAEAKRVCGQCSVREQCLTYALSADERHGIWGGLSTRERDQLVPGRRTKPLTRKQAQRKERDELIVTMSTQGSDPLTIAEQAKVTDRTVHRVLARHRTQVDAVPA